MKAMDLEVDHYGILGLPSGEKGAKLSKEEIKKAYKSKALELHPDKRPDDPNAHDNFQKLKTSYEILSDAKTRKIFDDLVRAKTEKIKIQLQRNSERERKGNYKQRKTMSEFEERERNFKRRKMMSDLEERERAAFTSYSTAKAARDEEERIDRKNKEVVAIIRDRMHANKATTAASILKKEAATGAKVDATFLSARQPLESSDGFHAYENLVLKKLRKGCRETKMLLQAIKTSERRMSLRVSEIQS